jgi:hypothetical protein
MSKTKLKYWSKDDAYKMGRPNSLSKDLLQKVNYESLRPYFAGNFGWRVNGKLADAYLYNLDDYDQKLVSSIKLKTGEKIYRYFNEITAIGGFVLFIKINIDKGLAYFVKDYDSEDIEFETQGTRLEWLNLIKEQFAKGGNLPEYNYSIAGL